MQQAIAAVRNNCNPSESTPNTTFCYAIKQCLSQEVTK